MPKRCVSYEDIEGWLEKIVAQNEMSRIEYQDNEDEEGYDYDPRKLEKRKKTITYDPFRRENLKMLEEERLAKRSRLSNEKKNTNNSLEKQVKTSAMKDKWKMKSTVETNPNPATEESNMPIKNRPLGKTIAPNLKKDTPEKTGATAHKEPTTKNKEAEIIIISDSDSC